jgi:transposase-like protein
MGNKPMTPMDDFERPKCPECQNELRLKLGAKDQDGKEWNSSWVCTQCLAEFYSEKTAQEWMNELRRKDVE